MGKSPFARKIFFISNSQLFISLVLIAVVPAIVFILSISFKENAVIIPNKDYKHYFYNDELSGGNSEFIKEYKDDSVIKFDFKLNDKINAPFVGMTIYSDSSVFQNISGYNQVEITMKCSHLEKVGLALYVKNPEPDSTNTLFYKIFSISDNRIKYTFHFDEFSIPSWWSERNTFPDDISLTSDNIANINISNAYTKNIDNIQSIEISSLEFSRSVKPELMLLILLLLVYFIILFTIFYTLKLIKDNKNTIVISYKPIDDASLSDNDIETNFINYINDNFCNPDLSLEMVAKQTYSSQRRITNYIQEQYSCNFKTYINRLRINESKRLLLDTDLSIGEIAYRIGFNNQSHFNRVFKTEMNDSPTNFRSKK